MATRTETRPPVLHVADSHDLIRVHGARANNLKDVSIELPKRRLTVSTGVSGSCKSSLVSGTIAVESQRMINETYSAFVQGFMPSMARPEVDPAQQLGVEGDDDRRHAHEHGPDRRRQGQPGPSQHAGRQRDGGQVVACAPRQVLEHLAVGGP